MLPPLPLAGLWRLFSSEAASSTSSEGKQERARPARAGSSSSSPRRTSGPSSSLTFLCVLRLTGPTQLLPCRIRQGERSYQLMINMRPRDVASLSLLIPGKRLVISRMTRTVWLMAWSTCPRYRKEIKPDKYSYNILPQIQDGVAAPPFLLLFFLLKFLLFPCFRLKIRQGRMIRPEGPDTGCGRHSQPQPEASDPRGNAYVQYSWFGFFSVR